MFVHPGWDEDQQGVEWPWWYLINVQNLDWLWKTKCWNAPYHNCKIRNTSETILLYTSTTCPTFYIAPHFRGRRLRWKKASYWNGDQSPNTRTDPIVHRSMEETEYPPLRQLQMSAIPGSVGFPWVACINPNLKLMLIGIIHWELQNLIIIQRLQISIPVMIFGCRIEAKNAIMNVNLTGFHWMGPIFGKNGNLW